MKKIATILMVILSLILVGIAIIVFSFVQSMKPDKEKEEEVRMQAEEYLEEKFNDNFEIFDTLYDNMGNFGFDYAAKARDKKNNTQFLIYYDDETKQMVDTYIADKWSDDVEKEIRPYINEHFGESTDVHVYFEDKIGKQLDIDPTKPKSYKEFDVKPTIRLAVPRKKSDEDEKLFNDFISFLESEDKLQQGVVIVRYIAENGEILEDTEWSKEF
ncbi:hypothetical protein ACIQ2D_18675 [Lysinibacillus sp. NPDC097287]|uniref:hypothetical protein n=1 Tax=Lysinibacillus sp. NPDC097287 TaxID=3364144 RepID=UPI0038120D37